MWRGVGKGIGEGESVEVATRGEGIGQRGAVDFDQFVKQCLLAGKTIENGIGIGEIAQRGNGIDRGNQQLAQPRRVGDLIGFEKRPRPQPQRLPLVTGLHQSNEMTFEEEHHVGTIVEYFAEDGNGQCEILCAKSGVASEGFIPGCRCWRCGWGS